jgi:hypothetical protein
MYNGNGKRENEECSIVPTRLPIQVPLQCVCLIIELMKRKRPAKIEVRGYNNNPGEYTQYYQNYLESNPIGNAKC